LKVCRATLSDLLHGKAALTPDIALRIEKAFGPDMNHMLRMQLADDVATTREHAPEIDVERYVPAQVQDFTNNSPYQLEPTMDTRLPSVSGLFILGARSPIWAASAGLRDSMGAGKFRKTISKPRSKRFRGSTRSTRASSA
jgi:plasmid maintenance system antidote protein VapI